MHARVGADPGVGSAARIAALQPSTAVHASNVGDRLTLASWLWHHARRQASLPVAADLPAWRSSPRRPHALPGETPGRRSFAPDSFCLSIWLTSRGGPDHRHDPGLDCLGQLGLGGRNLATGVSATVEAGPRAERERVRGGTDPKRRSAKSRRGKFSAGRKHLCRSDELGSIRRGLKRDSSKRGVETEPATLFHLRGHFGHGRDGTRLERRGSLY